MCKAPAWPLAQALRQHQGQVTQRPKVSGAGKAEGVRKGSLPSIGSLLNEDGPAPDWPVLIGPLRF